MAKKKKGSKAKRSKGKKPRSAAQKAATRRMLAAAAKARGGGGGGRTSSKKRGKKRGKAKHRRSNPATSLVTAANPTTKRRKGKHRRRNPSVPEPLMRAGSAVLQGVIGAGVTAGGVLLAQKLPAKSKLVAIGVQAGLGIVGGAALGALGLPIAGTIVAAGFGGTAIQTAMAPSAASTQGSQVSGLVEKQKMRGLMDGDALHRAAQDDYNQVRGLVENLN